MLRRNPLNKNILIKINAPKMKSIVSRLYVKLGRKIVKKHIIIIKGKLIRYHLVDVIHIISPSLTAISLLFIPNCVTFM